MAADGRVDLGTEEPPGRGPKAQRREVRPGDLHALAVDRPLSVGDVDGERAVGGQVGEDRLCPLEIAEHRIAEDLVAPAGAVAAGRPRLGSRGLEVDEPFRRGDRQRTQQHLAEDGEDRRVRSNAEGQRQDRHARHDRRPEQHAGTRVGRWSSSVPAPPRTVPRGRGCGSTRGPRGSRGPAVAALPAGRRAHAALRSRARRAAVIRRLARGRRDCGRGAFANGPATHRALARKAWFDGPVTPMVASTSPRLPCIYGTIPLGKQGRRAAGSRSRSRAGRRSAAPRRPRRSRSPWVG